MSSVIYNAYDLFDAAVSRHAQRAREAQARNRALGIAHVLRFCPACEHQAKEWSPRAGIRRGDPDNPHEPRAIRNKIVWEAPREEVSA